MVMPRYQRAGIAISRMPNVSTVGLQESARTSQALSQSLDRIASFAFRQAEVQAQVAGQEYGATNAPTQEQLEQAISTGVDVSRIVPGDTTTVYGRAARSTALDSIAIEMELTARESIASLQAQFENGDITLQTLQISMDTMRSEQANVLSKVSPLAAQKYEASVGIIANSAYLAAAKTQATRNKIDNEIRARAGVDRFIADVPTLVKGGSTQEREDSTIITPDMRIEAAAKEIESLAMIIDDVDFYQTKMDELRKAVTEAKINVVMEEALQNPSRGMAAVRGKVKFQDEDVQETFDSMTIEQRQALYERTQQALSAKRSEDTQAEAVANRQKVKDTEKKETELLQAIASNDIDAQTRIMGELYEINTAVHNSYFKAINIDGGYDDQDTVALLEFQVIQGKLTREAVNDARADQLISSATYTSLLTKIANRDDESYNEAMRIVKGDLGLPDKPFANADIIDRGAQQLVAQVERELILERRKNPAVDPVAFVLPKIKEIKDNQADAKARNRARSALEQARRRFDRDGSRNLTATALLEAARNAKYPTEGAKQAAIQGLELYIRLEEEARLR